MVSHFDAGNIQFDCIDRDIAADKLQSDLGKCYKHTREK